jgi:3-phenylpropionate/trans-cinnamate dioxygenase ferredoxin reductase subunit
MMSSTKYLIIGGGMTGDAAVRGIRKVEPGAEIALLAAEPHPPYNRPPLSKGLWKDKPLDGIWRRTESEGLTLFLGRTATRLDLDAGLVVDDEGREHGYERLLLATGGTPRRLPFGGDEIIYFRTLDDYRRLRNLTATGQRFAVIGGGFIGCEVAAALAGIGRKVVMAFPEAGIGARIFPRDLSLFLNGYFAEKGVEVRAGERAAGLDREERRLVLHTEAPDGVAHHVPVDGVVAGLGIQPNVELARVAGLEVGDGVIVDEQLRTSHESVWAAGDVALFPSAALGVRVRVEHEDNALAQGSIAGQNMAGAGLAYHHLPFFYSDLFELGYEAVGELDSRLDVVADWQEPFRKGVVYYLRGEQVRGVLLWNVWGKVDAARELIASRKTFHPGDLKGRIQG